MAIRGHVGSMEGSYVTGWVASFVKGATPNRFFPIAKSLRHTASILITPAKAAAARRGA
ncbi:hypothetical protein GCM10010909_15390 [Acidocella aquatica]|uniref:Uncharacterized protein n=1 Tax=Acidocella aquatica TaxID=1922313 RepID=A0ABQ6A3X9_9PROT|nr:hypothetical protein [Acidocella aquatica]GLR66859.1 hypothetical protein GCM10010909_15390 [Acidocella aquatica]